MLEAEDLVERPAAALERLTGFLSLRVPLSAQYDVFPNTGVPGAGDTSALIRSGRIATRAPGSPEFTPGETLAGLYDAALQELTRRSVEPARTPSACIGDAGGPRSETGDGAVVRGSPAGRCDGTVVRGSGTSCPPGLGEL